MKLVSRCLIDLTAVNTMTSSDGSPLFTSRQQERPEVETINSVLRALNTNAYDERRRNKRLSYDVRVLAAVFNILVRLTITPARHIFVTERNPCAKFLEFLNQAASWFLNRFISKHNANSELLFFSFAGLCPSSGILQT